MGLPHLRMNHSRAQHMPRQSTGALAKCRSNAQLGQVRIQRDKHVRTCHRQGRNLSRPREDIRHPKRMPLTTSPKSTDHGYDKSAHTTHSASPFIIRISQYPLMHSLLDWGQYYCSRVVMTTAGNQSPMHPNPRWKRNYAMPRLKRKH